MSASMTKVATFKGTFFFRQKESTHYKEPPSPPSESRIGHRTGPLNLFFQFRRPPKIIFFIDLWGHRLIYIVDFLRGCGGGGYSIHMNANLASNGNGVTAGTFGPTFKSYFGIQNLNRNFSFN